MLAFCSGLFIGFIIGAVVALTAWLAAGAYFEARRKNTAETEVTSPTTATTTSQPIVSSEIPVSPTDTNYPASQERFAPLTRLFGRVKTGGYPTATPKTSREGRRW